MPAQCVQNSTILICFLSILVSLTIFSRKHLKAICVFCSINCLFMSSARFFNWVVHLMSHWLIEMYIKRNNHFTNYIEDWTSFHMFKSHSIFSSELSIYIVSLLCPLDYWFFSPWVVESPRFWTPFQPLTLAMPSPLMTLYFSAFHKMEEHFISEHVNTNFLNITNSENIGSKLIFFFSNGQDNVNHLVSGKCITIYKLLE